LDQLQLKGSYRVEPVDQIVRVTVGGRVPQGAKRIERLDRLLRLIGRVDTLGLVDDDDGPRRLHKLDGLVSRELVTLFVDDVALLLFFGAGEVLAEGIDVDDQNLQRIAGGELAESIDSPGIIDKVLEGEIIVKGTEVLGSDLNILEHTFADSDAGYHDNELL